MTIEPSRYPNRPGSLVRAVQREMQRPVEHHFTSPRVIPVGRRAPERS